MEGGNARRAVENRAFLPLLYELETTDYTRNPVGIGMGQGAAAISKLMTGTVTFTTGEGELGRVMDELGPIPGVTFMLFRVFLALFLFLQALSEARRLQPLALLLAPMTLSAVVFAVCEQPTEQGFMVIGIAFTLAALKLRKEPATFAGVRNQKRPVVRYSAQPKNDQPGAAFKIVTS
jgi:hypothetical protein